MEEALRALLLPASDRAVRLVTAVTSLCQRVGRERCEGLGCHQLIDDAREISVVDDVEVIHDLASLVAEVTEALESGRPTHARLLCRVGMRVRCPSHR
jgi:hypothetical protein